MEKIRLSKRMSELGLCSRREADSYIEKGWVEVDGEIVSELGTKVFPSQKVTLRTAAQNTQQQRVTILLNKPVGYVSGQAEHNYKPAITLLDESTRWREDESPTRFHRSQLVGIAPAGRLDIDSTGLLVLTQDGRIAKRLIGEDSPVDKEYLVRVQGQMKDGGLALLCHGLKLDGEYLKPAKVTWQNEDQLR
ncbi:MAG TPA: pseudouridine synthase, partial [Gallionella sp.]|nr:pseudouridine synthase [Gallionella sp.]